MGAYRFLFTGKWIGSFVLCIIFSIICVYLAGWQMSRKEALDWRNSLIVQNYHATPYNFQDHPTIFQDFDSGSQWHPVSLRGQYIADQQLLVRNRPYQGQNGFEVLVPFRADTGEIVIINRGWMSASSSDASRPSTEVPAPPANDVIVVARVHQGESATGKDAPEGQVASINLQEIGERMHLPVAAGAYGLLDSEEPTPVQRPVQKSEPELDNGPNLSYSMQWYAFAVLIYAVYAWSARQKVRNDELDAQVAQELERYYRQFYAEDGSYIGHEDETVVLRKMDMIDDMPSHMKSIVRPRPAKKHSRLTDEEEEDAFLDRLERP